MQLILVRHGETDWNRDGRYQGQADPPLNASGRAQAEAAAAALAGLPLVAIYSSDLRRALETARIIAAKRGLEVTQDSRLREIRLGAWEGMLTYDIAAAYPVEWAARQENPIQSRSPGGETIAEVAARVWAAADAIACRHPRGPVVIVSHGLALSTLLCKASGLSLGQAFRTPVANASQTPIEWACPGN